MRNLLHALVVVGSSSATNAIVAVVRNKLLAIWMGPTGLGLFAQLLGLQAVAAGLAPLGMQTGSLRFFARYRTGNRERLCAFVATSQRTFLVLAALTSAALLAFLEPLTRLTIDLPGYALYVVPAILGIPLLVLGQLWLNLVQAGLDMKSYARALIFTAVGGLLLLAPLTIFWGTKGVALHLLLYAAMGYGVARFFARRAMDSELRRAMEQARPTREAAAALLRFGIANFPVLILGLLVPYAIRTQIVQDQGLTVNGFYQVLHGFATQYLAIPVSAVLTYSFPRISQLREPAQINDEVNRALRVLLLATTLGILVVLLAREWLVRLFFSEAFLPAAALLAPMMLGTLWQAAGWAVQLPLVPQERYRARVWMAVLQVAALLGVFYAFPPSQRLQGAVWGFTASWGVHVAVHVAYLRRVNGYRLTPRVKWLLAAATASVIAVGWMPLPDPLGRWVGALVGVVWLTVSVTRSEMRKALAMARGRIGSAPGPGPEPEQLP